MSKYELFGQNIFFPDSTERFFDMYYRMYEATASASADFDAWYLQCGNILSVLRGYKSKTSELVISYARDPLFSELPSYEIFDINKDSYDKECLDFSKSSDAFDIISGEYDDIVAEQAAEEEYRAERKANRGRVVGGGFGVGGGLKGMATAGAMNAISGAGHGIINAIGNVGSAVAASSSKKTLYNNEDTRKILWQGIKTDLLGCFCAHIHLLNERFPSYIVDMFNLDKAQALFENAKRVTEKQKELLISSFKNCPWDKELLKFIFINYKAERKHVWDISKRFHVDLSKIAEEVFAASYTEKAKKTK